MDDLHNYTLYGEDTPSAAAQGSQPEPYNIHFQMKMIQRCMQHLHECIYARYVVRSTRPLFRLVGEGEADQRGEVLDVAIVVHLFRVAVDAAVVLAVQMAAPAVPSPYNAYVNNLCQMCMHLCGVVTTGHRHSSSPSGRLLASTLLWAGTAPASALRPEAPRHPLRAQTPEAEWPQMR